MHIPLYDHNAKHKTISVTLNADLVARSAAHGWNTSRIAEVALVAAFEAAEKAVIHKELQEDARFLAAYVAEHGYPFSNRWLTTYREQDDNNAA